VTIRNEHFEQGDHCEHAIKKAILHRKNSMFYKTRNGAHVGDM